ncbi:hypothetical protein B0A49_08884, partial [Cryomyces minteri]
AGAAGLAGFGGVEDWVAGLMVLELAVSMFGMRMRGKWVGESLAAPVRRLAVPGADVALSDRVPFLAVVSVGGAEGSRLRAVWWGDGVVGGVVVEKGLRGAFDGE